MARLVAVAFLLMFYLNARAFVFEAPRCDPPARWVCEGKKCRCVASAVMP